MFGNEWGWQANETKETILNTQYIELSKHIKQVLISVYLRCCRAEVYFRISGPKPRVILVLNIYYTPMRIDNVASFLYFWFSSKPLYSSIITPSARGTFLSVVHVPSRANICRILSQPSTTADHFTDGVPPPWVHFGTLQQIVIISKIVISWFGENVFAKLAFSQAS